MPTQENKALIRLYFATLNGKAKPAALVAEFTADEELKQHIAFFEAAFPRYELIADDMISEGEQVVVRARFRGVHGGEMMGIPPTGKQAEVPFIIIYRIAGDKIVEHWMSVNQLDLLQQLGVAPTMA